MEVLGLQGAEEALHRSIVQTVPFPRHALGQRLPCQQGTIGGMLVMPSLDALLSVKWRFVPGGSLDGGCAAHSTAPERYSVSGTG